MRKTGPTTRIFTWNEKIRVSITPRTEKRQHELYLKDVYPCFLRGYSDKGWFKISVQVPVKIITEGLVKAHMDCMLQDALCGLMSEDDFGSAYGYQPDDPSLHQAYRKCKSTLNMFLKVLDESEILEMKGKESSIK